MAENPLWDIIDVCLARYFSGMAVSRQLEAEQPKFQFSASESVKHRPPPRVPCPVWYRLNNAALLGAGRVNLNERPSKLLKRVGSRVRYVDANSL